MRTEFFWGAVRLASDVGKEYVLPCDMSGDLEMAKQLANKTDKETGISWSDNNPVVRFARFSIVEAV